MQRKHVCTHLKVSETLKNGYVESALMTFVAFNFSRRDFRRQVVYGLACFLDEIQRESSEISDGNNTTIG